MAYAVIDYGYGKAEFWSEFDRKTVKRSFMHHANQCFGIRKSISGFNLLEFGDDPMPEPWCLLPGAATMLKHSGDTIVWGADGEKIKSEFD